MKRVYNFKDFDGKTETKEVEVRDLNHLDAQITFKAHVFRPKKGKGSFTRKIKYKEIIGE